MIKVVRTGTAEELFQINIDPAPSIGDELIIDDEPYLVTGRRFVLEDIGRGTRSVEYTTLYVQRTW